jgi:hypothetical protein
MSGASPLFAGLLPHYWPDGEAPRIHPTTAGAVLSAVVLQGGLRSPVRAADSAGRTPSRTRTTRTVGRRASRTGSRTPIRPAVTRVGICTPTSTTPIP